MRSANRSRGKPPPTRSGAACSGKNSNSPPSSPDAINRPLTRIRHGDSRHRNRNAQYLVGPSSKDFQALSTVVGRALGFACSAAQARSLVAGARDVLRVAAAILVNALGREFQHPIGQGGEEVPVVRD